MKKKRSIMKFAGSLNMSDEEAEEIKLNIAKLSKRSAKDLLREIEIMNN